MSNASAHFLGAGLVVGTGLWAEEQRRGLNTAAPYVGGSLAAFMGSLPDLLEPAHHPHHRQFCHSVTFAIGMTYGLYRIYKWEPRNDKERFFRFLGLAASGAYLTHLAMDSMTSRSIPLVGNLNSFRPLA